MTHPAWLAPPNDSTAPVRLDALMHYWLGQRAGTVAAKTLRADQDLLRLIPRAYLSRDVSSIGPQEVMGILSGLRARGLSELSVRRHRSSLSQFFGWCFRTGLIGRTPVDATVEPVAVTPAEINPFTSDELEAAWAEWSGYSPVLADVMLVLARTGLRWSEARALSVADADADELVVSRSCCEGASGRRLAAGQVRRVPVVPRIRPILQRLLAGRDADELLLTTSLGSQLHRTAVLRRLNWPLTGRGRRLHDLRHTAAYLWLDEGVAARDVRDWMGPTRLAA